VTDAYRHSTPVQVRFRDVDAFGHVNNAVFFSYVELARIRYLLEVIEPSESFDRLPLILARVELDYRSPIRFGENVVVETRVERVGRTSFEMSHRMTAGSDSRLVADVRTVLVSYDYAAARPILVSSKWRRRFGAFEGASFETEPDTEPSRREAAATG
jgi:acyl-CoA thioester hydrolase